jgi:radical SAM protein with 4Fe4S-binding SPASM domain
MKPSLDLEVTRRCNLRCDYCFVGWSRDWQSDLPVDVAEQIVDEGAGLFPILHFTGGEPFAYAALLDLVDRGIARGYGEVLINTNGTMLAPAAIERLAAHRGRAALSVSLDGPEAIHDRVRGAGRFREASRAVDALIAAGVPVTVMTVVTPEVLRALPAFLRALVADHPGLAGVTLFPVGVGPAGSQRPGAALRSLTPAEVRELALVVALAYKTGLRATVGAYPIVNPLLAAMGAPRDALYQCTAGRGRVCVHADLTVSPCHPVREAVYGRWESGLFARLAAMGDHDRLARRDFDGCRDCDHVEACGHCRAFVAASGAPLLGNDEVCRDVLPGGAGAPTRRVALPIARG